MKYAEKLVRVVHWVCGSNTAFVSGYEAEGKPNEVVVDFDARADHPRITLTSGTILVEERIVGMRIQDAIARTAKEIAQDEAAIEKLALDGMVRMIGYADGIILTSYVRTVGGMVTTKVRVNQQSAIRAMIWQPTEGQSHFLVPDPKDSLGSWDNPHGDYDEESYLESLARLPGGG